MRISLISSVAALLAVAIVAVPGVATADADVAWSVQTSDNAHGKGRAHFAYDVDPGQVITDEMLVTNTGTTPLDLDVYAADAFTTSSGNLDIRPAGEVSTDGGSWITAARTDVTLAPGEQAPLPFTVTVPADATPGDHPAGLVTSLTTDTGDTVSIDRRLGSRINIRVSGDLHPAAAITDVDVTYSGGWNPFSSGTAVVSYALTNTGNTRIVSSDLATLSGPAGIAPASVTGDDGIEVMPGSTIQVSREVSLFGVGFASGTLTVSPVAVGLGAADMQALTADLSTAAVPWGLIVLLVALILIAFVIVLIVRRSRRKKAAELR